jgi:hypothetical protein
MKFMIIKECKWLISVDNREEVDLYTAAGFVKLEGHNSMTAYIPRLISGLD